MDIGYARVSTQDQDPQLQINALEAADCWPIYQERVSGIAKHRPVRDEALATLKRGDTLTCWKLDRLGRSVIELHAIVRDLKERGVRFRVLTQNIDTSTAMGMFFFTLLAAFAEMEREMIMERTAAGRQLRAEKGLPPGGPRRFGVAPDRVTVVEHEAELIREAARRLLAGDNLSQIVEDWNDRGVRPVRGDRWRVTALRLVLTNRRVVPIVGEKSYLALAELFGPERSQRRHDRQRQGRPAEHLLSGILTCGREGCGQPLYAAQKGGTGRPMQMVYRCKKAAGSGGRHAGCGSTVVSMARADSWAEEAFIAAAASEDFAKAVNRRQAELLAGEVTVSELDDWRKEIDELELVIPTRYGTEVHQQRHEQLQRMVHDATTRLLRRPDLQAMVDLPRTETKLRARWESWSVTERRVWLRRLLDRIEVKPATVVRGPATDVESRMSPVWRI
jgi:DNA invertase Pin-like site-specific DNA recombinase